MPNLKGIRQGSLLRFEVKVNASDKRNQVFGHELLFTNMVTSNMFITGLISWVHQARIKVLVEEIPLTKTDRKWLVVVEFIMNMDSTKGKNGCGIWEHKTKLDAVQHASDLRRKLKSKKTWNEIEGTLNLIKYIKI
ncbi:MAG: hypothetical protein P1Q69_10515 [Candidatus Thorarchaeota archaeon]|nr:hypothetical protein [Candidatus Thorarchaeota archaeon]